MTAITIQGYKFEVPEGAIASIVVGYTLQEEGEVHALRQTKLENLRNNFAAKVKAKLNGAETIPDDDLAALQSEFGEYAVAYKFGLRAPGEARQKLDPVTREMLKLAKDDFAKAYYAKYGEKADKELVAARGEELMDKRRDDYQKRARAILRQREQIATDTLETLGL
jgi:hypothetical protein